MEAVARFLRADPRAAVRAAASLVDADHASVDARRDVLRPRKIAAEDRGAEPEGRVVRESQRFVDRAERLDACDRPERLFAHDVHCVGDVGEDRRRHEVAVARFASRDQRRARGNRGIDLRHDFRLLPRRHHRADIDALITRISLLQRARPLGHFSQEFLANRCIDVDTFGAHADLPRVAETVAHRERGRRVEVGIVEHNKRVFAAEFKDDALQARPRVGENALPGFARTGEDDEINVREDERAPLRAVAEDRREHARWKEFVENLRVLTGDERGFFARLEEHRVPRNKRGQHRLMRHQNREVPRRDRGANAKRRVAQNAANARVFAHRVGKRRHDFVEFACKTVGAVVRLANRFGKRLPHLARSEFTESPRFRLQTRRRRPQYFRALGVRQRAPTTLRLA